MELLPQKYVKNLIDAQLAKVHPPLGGQDPGIDVFRWVPGEEVEDVHTTTKSLEKRVVVEGQEGRYIFVGAGEMGGQREGLGRWAEHLFAVNFSLFFFFLFVFFVAQKLIT